MQKFLINFSLFAGALALVSALLNGVSIPTSLLRAALVFLGTLFLFIVALNLIRWSIVSTTVVEHKVDKKQNETKSGEQAQMQKNLADSGIDLQGLNEGENKTENAA